MNERRDRNSRHGPDKTRGPSPGEEWDPYVVWTQHVKRSGTAHDPEPVRSPGQHKPRQRD